MDRASDVPVPGVRAIDHAADVGLDVEAPDPGTLFERAAAGMAWLLTETPLPAPVRSFSVSLAAADRAGLLRAFLREVLLRHEDDGFAFAAADFAVLGEERLEAVVRGGTGPATPVREIKGVTLHGLEVTERNGGWVARVIFDV